MQYVTHFKTNARVPWVGNYWGEIPDSVACGGRSRLSTTNWKEVTCSQCFHAKTRGMAIRMRCLRLRNVTLRDTFNALGGCIKEHPTFLIATLIATAGVVVGLLNWLFPRA